mmetsp:Transcript_15663/g.44600  ORF Transcript_15663/g.44600 Transcript_15663/m.44600 type:complete len:213 (-) Transcript_15663:400-1038(-)
MMAISSLGSVGGVSDGSLTPPSPSCAHGDFGPIRLDSARGTTASLPSAGSVDHWAEGCKPCLFVTTAAGCSKGVLCDFCHFSHKGRQIPRPGKAKRNRYKKLVERRIALARADIEVSESDDSVSRAEDPECRRAAFDSQASRLRSDVAVAVQGKLDPFGFAPLMMPGNPSPMASPIVPPSPPPRLRVRCGDGVPYLPGPNGTSVCFGVVYSF